MVIISEKHTCVVWRLAWINKKDTGLVPFCPQTFGFGYIIIWENWALVVVFPNKSPWWKYSILVPCFMVMFARGCQGWLPSGCSRLRSWALRIIFVGSVCAHVSFSLAILVPGPYTPCGACCAHVWRLPVPSLVLCEVHYFPAPALLTWLWGGLLCPWSARPLVPLVCAVSGEPVEHLRVLSECCWLCRLRFRFCNVNPGLFYLLLTSGYCFRFFCSFANKVALTKADLQGREGSYSHYHFGLKDAPCNPWYLSFRGLQAVTPLRQLPLWGGGWNQCSSKRVTETPHPCM